MEEYLEGKNSIKVAFFVRSAASGKILPRENLQWQGAILVNWCCMCKKDRESIDHLPLHCSMARELWALALSLFAIHWVMPKRVADFWKRRFDRHHNGDNWNAIPLCVMGIIQWERNGQTFEDTE